MSPSNSTTTATVVSIVTSALQLAPLALVTVQGIRDLLSKDPSVPEQLRAILAQTDTDNAATLQAVQQWLADNPPSK